MGVRTRYAADLPADPDLHWSAVHVPTIANSRAAATRAAGGTGVRHIATSITATLASVAAPTAETVRLRLRDGTTGAGTILWETRLSIEAVAGQKVIFALSGLTIVGSANTAMTLEFDVAPGTNVFQAVNLTGWSLSG